MDSEIHPKAEKNNSIEKYNDAVSRKNQDGFYSVPVESSLYAGIWEWTGR